MWEMEPLYRLLLRCSPISETQSGRYEVMRPTTCELSDNLHANEQCGVPGATVQSAYLEGRLTRSGISLSRSRQPSRRYRVGET